MVTNTFRFSLYRCLRTLTERLYTMGCHIFSEKYDRELSYAISYGWRQAAISWRASGNRQISLNASAERAFANFRDKKHRILQLQIFATKTSFFTHFCNKNGKWLKMRHPKADLSLLSASDILRYIFVLPSTFDIFCPAERLRYMTCRLTSDISTKEFHH